MENKTIDLEKYVEDKIDMSKVSAFTDHDEFKLVGFRFVRSPIVRNLEFLDSDFVIPDKDIQDIESPIENQSDSTLTTTLRLLAQESRNESFTTHVSLTNTVGAAVSAGGTLFGASVKVTATWELSLTAGFEAQTSMSESAERELMVEVEVPPKSIQIIRLVTSRKTSKVPWIADIDLSEAKLELDIRPKAYLKAKLYEHPNYDTWRKSLHTDNWPDFGYEKNGSFYVDNLRDIKGTNDKLSSLRLYGWGTIKFYEHQNQKGDSWTAELTGKNRSFKYLYSFNDKASSVKFTPGAPDDKPVVKVKQIMSKKHLNIEVGGEFESDKTTARVKAGPTHSI